MISYLQFQISGICVIMTEKLRFSPGFSTGNQGGKAPEMEIAIAFWMGLEYNYGALMST